MFYILFFPDQMFNLYLSFLRIFWQTVKNLPYTLDQYSFSLKLLLCGRFNIEIILYIF